MHTIRWRSKKMINWRRLFKLNMAILNIKSCPLHFPTYRPAFKVTSIRFWPRNLISLLLCIWMTSHLYKKSRSKPYRYSIMGFWSFEAVWLLCQPQEMLFPSRWSKFLRLRFVSSRYPKRRTKDQSSQELAWTKVSMRYLGLHRICKFLLTLYSRFY